MIDCLPDILSMGYEYKVVEVQIWNGSRIDTNAEEVIRQHTNEGWRIAHTILRNGYTWVRL